MKNIDLARQYVFAIRKIREHGGVNYAKPNIVAMMKIAENVLIRAGIVEPANKGRYIWISEHATYESDLIDFVYKYF